RSFPGGITAGGGNSSPDADSSAGAVPSIRAIAPERPASGSEGSLSMRSPSGAQVRRTALAALSALALATSPEIGRAADSDGAAARQRYLAGAQAYAAGNYADAVDQFMAADRILPSAALSFDIARAYEKLGESSLA